MKKWKLLRSVALSLLLPFLIVYPLLISPSPGATNVAVYVLLYMGAAIAWNLFAGFTGYINLGSATYLGIGGYAMAILCRDLQVAGGYTPFLLLPLAGIIAALCAVPLGWLVLRVRRHAFMVLTLALLSIGQYLAYNVN